jgi:hypothetical protein
LDGNHGQDVRIQKIMVKKGTFGHWLYFPKPKKKVAVIEFLQ